MAFAALFNRILQLQHSLGQVSQLIVKLSKTHVAALPKPTGDIPFSSGIESDESRPLLGQEIHDILKRDEEELELLRQEVEELEPQSNTAFAALRGESFSTRASERNREHRRLIASCARLAEELRLLRGRFRKAQLQAKRNAEAFVQEERFAHLAELRATSEANIRSKDGPFVDQNRSFEEMRKSLLNHGGVGNRTKSSGMKEDVMLTASADLTSSLRRTHDLLNSEVSRSRFAHETLSSSNSALEELNKRYGRLDDLLSRSRGLLSSLLRSQKSDTWYLETTLYILLGTLGWLLFRRLLYGPTWWLLWKPLRIIWNCVGWAFAMLFWIISGARHVTNPGAASSSLAAVPIATGSPPPLSLDGPTYSSDPSDSKEGNREQAKGYTNLSITRSLNEVISSFASSSLATAQPAAYQVHEDPGNSDVTLEYDVTKDEPHKAKYGSSDTEEEIVRPMGAMEAPDPKKRMFEDPPTAKGQIEKEEL